jgi:hypothetical protein
VKRIRRNEPAGSVEMAEYLELSKETLDTNDDLWQIEEVEGEAILHIVKNMSQDYIHGKVALFRERLKNYRMRAEMRFLGHHMAEGSGGWFGFAIRAQDTENYELVWFMPNAGDEKAIAYVPVAHGIVPWWAEAYSTQQKGVAAIPADDWFQAQVEAKDDEFAIYVEGRKVFTKRFSYYLDEGRPGFYVGTATDAAFRRVEIESLE